MANPPFPASSPATPKRDWLRNVFSGNGLFWLLYAVFLVFSMITVSSALSSQYYQAVHDGRLAPQLKHGIVLFVGLVATIITSKIPAKHLRNSLPGVSLVLMLLLAIALGLFGEARNDAERWFRVLGVSIQPAEFLRLYIIIWGAHIMTFKPVGTETPEGKEKRLMLSFVIYGGQIALWAYVFARANLSMLIIYAVIFYIYCWMLGAPKRFMRWLTLAGGAVVLLFSLYITLAPQELLIGRSKTWQARVHRMIEPTDTLQLTTPTYNLDERYQEEAARMAVASAGRGVGQSKMRDHLPLAFSDYLYATIIEEYGLLGILFVPSLYIAWLWLAYREAKKQTDKYRKMLIQGFAILFPMQALVNMLVTSGLFTTGQPLPLLSWGGSSILASSIAFGLSIAASRVDRPKRQRPLSETFPPDAPSVEAEVFPENDDPEELDDDLPLSAPSSPSSE